MLNTLPPWNIALLLPMGSELVRKYSLRQIKVMDIMAGMTRNLNFHPDGLYSTEIFGRVGEARRQRTFGFVDLHIPIFHPVYLKALTDLKELYGGIISGREYAIFDHQTKDFIKSDAIHGETGYRFFLDHFEELKFSERESPARMFNIKFVEKYRKNPMFDKLMVLPAGLRDYTVDENGKPTEDEINNLYRKVIGISLLVENVTVASNEEALNSMRYNLQQAVNAIYEYIINILEGKGKLIQGKWTARNIDNSTRNVITPYIQRVNERDHPQFVSATQHVVGLYQFLRTIFPKSIQLVRDSFLSSVFSGPNVAANLIDSKTLKGVNVHVDPSFYDDWMTLDGLEKMFHNFKTKDLRHEPVRVGHYFLGLIYNDGRQYRLMNGIEELPDGFDPKYVSPITYTELFYLAVFKTAPKIVGTITRYPITGFGSVYPSYNYLKTTIDGLVLQELNDNWTPTGQVAPEFPKRGDFFFDALSPASQHLGRLGGDYDGDMCSLICFLSDDAMEELDDLLESRDFYVSVSGELAFSSANDVLGLVLGNMA